MLTLYTVLALGATALADATLTKYACIDPSGFSSCQSTASQKTSVCIAQAKKDGSQKELLACGCQDSVDNFNCYATHCWNQVWGCQYQNYMVNYFRTCPIAKQPVPYFPIPKDAQGACSCNLGQVFLSYNAAIQQSGQCSQNSQSGDPGSNLQRMQGCSCCQVSGALSSIFEICPATDPNLIGLRNLEQLQIAANTQFDQCGKYLNTYDCVSDLGFKIDGVSKFLKPDDPLTTGTATLSDGPGTVTAPASGRVFTYTNGGDGTVYTITAAGKFSDNGGSAGSGGDGKGSGSDDKGSGGDSKGDASPSATDKPKNAAVTVKSGGSLAVAVAVMVAVFI